MTERLELKGAGVFFRQLSVDADWILGDSGTYGELPVRLLCLTSIGWLDQGVLKQCDEIAVTGAWYAYIRDLSPRASMHFSPLLFRDHISYSSSPFARCLFGLLFHTYGLFLQRLGVWGFGEFVAARVLARWAYCLLETTAYTPIHSILFCSGTSDEVGEALVGKGRGRLLRSGLLRGELILTGNLEYVIRQGMDYTISFPFYFNQHLISESFFNSVYSELNFILAPEILLIHTLSILPITVLFTKTRIHRIYPKKKARTASWT